MKMQGRDPQAGITLIEVLVVLAVIGIGAGAMLMSVGDRGRGAQEEAVKLAWALALGMDEALITSQPLALHWDARGYSFVQMRAGGQVTDSTTQDGNGVQGWPAATPPILGMRHDLPERLLLRQVGAATAEDATARIVMLSPGAAASPVTLEVFGAGTPWIITFDGFAAIASAGGAT